LETLEFCRAARARGEHALAATVLDAAIAQLTAEDAATLATLLLERAELALAAGDVATADDMARRAGPLAQQAEDVAVMAQAAWTVGQVTARQEDVDRTRYWLGQATELALTAEAWPLALRAQRGLANLMQGAGDTDGAIARLQALAADAAVLELPTEFAACHLDLAQLALARDDGPATLHHMQEVLRDPDRLPPLLRGEAGLVRARLLLAIGDVHAAVAGVAEAVALLRLSGDQRSLGAGLLIQGQLLLLHGQGESAGRALGEALAVTVRANLPERAVVEAVIARLGDRPN
jgi:ATP/maltotriose-dependent transcriptional regulator MalT